MRICKYAELNNDNPYYITGLAYTPGYKNSYNNIKCEIAALGLTYYTLLTKEIPTYGELWDYKSDIPHIDWFFNNAKLLIKDRPTIHQIMDTAPPDLIKSEYTGTLFTHDVPCSTNTTRIIDRAYNLNCSARTLFLALHVVRRTYTGRNLRIYGLVILNMVANIIVPQSNYDIVTSFQINQGDEEEEEYDVAYQTFKNNYKQMSIEILKQTRGVISTITYWDSARSARDLFPLLNAYVNCNNSEATNKCIRVRDFLSKEYVFAIGKGTYKVRHTIYPCKLDVQADIATLYKLLVYQYQWNTYEPD